jgi:hypothetical protein
MSEITESKINPKITDVEVGIRSLRKIKIYPLAVGDQLELTDMITEALHHFYGKMEETPGDNEFVLFIISMIKKNLFKIIELVTCGEEKDSLLKEITNEQFVELAEKIYEVNFATVRKNLKSLFEKIQNPLPSERPSLTSVKNMEDTVSNTSTEEVLNTEELR